MKQNIEPLDNFENQINDDSDILIEGDSNNVTINKHAKMSKTKIVLSIGGATALATLPATAVYNIEHSKNQEILSEKDKIIDRLHKLITQTNTKNIVNNVLGYTSYTNTKKHNLKKFNKAELKEKIELLELLKTIKTAPEDQKIINDAIKLLKDELESRK